PLPAPRPATLLAVVLACIPTLAFAQAGPDAPLLSTDDRRPAAGYFHLSWEVDGGPVELEEATTADFADARLVYRGSDGARLMSGKPTGSWYYRLRRLGQRAPSAWSETVQVDSRHHSFRRALAV